jgi:glucosamine--fructose-6-phosphate aminotransferase (isomerizing)
MNSQAAAFDLSHELGLAAAAMEAVISQKEELEQLAFDYFQDSRNAFLSAEAMITLFR